MLIMTCDQIPEKSYTVLGTVIGSVVKSKNIGKDIGAGLKSIVGGELRSYTKMQEEARKEAIERMTAEAEALGADAIIAMRLSSSSIIQGASEMIAYGTAVKFN